MEKKNFLLIIFSILAILIVSLLIYAFKPVIKSYNKPPSAVLNSNEITSIQKTDFKELSKEVQTEILSDPQNFWHDMEWSINEEWDEIDWENVTPEQYQSTLRDAVESQDKNKIIYIFKKDNFNINDDSRLYNNAFSIACNLGYNDIVSLFLEYDADPNLPDMYNYTPLSQALTNIGMEGNQEVFYTLINKGASLQWANNGYQGQNYLMYVADNFPPEDILQKLVDNIDVNEINNTHSFLKYQYEVNPVKEYGDDTGLTALHYAVAVRRNDTIEFLLNNGADKTIKTKMGRTPYDYGIIERDFKINELCKPTGRYYKWIYKIPERSNYYKDKPDPTNEEIDKCISETTTDWEDTLNLLKID